MYPGTRHLPSAWLPRIYSTPISSAVLSAYLLSCTYRVSFALSFPAIPTSGISGALLPQLPGSVSSQ